MGGETDLARDNCLSTTNILTETEKVASSLGTKLIRLIALEKMTVR